jgi:hypothetical protein
MNSLTNDEEFASAINDMFEKIPFNKVLCIKVESIQVY